MCAAAVLGLQAGGTYDAAVVLRAKGRGEYSHTVGTGLKPVSFVKGMLDYTWDNADEPLFFKDIPESGPFRVTAGTRLTGSWKGSHEVTVDLKVGEYKGYCVLEDSHRRASVKVTLERTAGDPDTITVTLEPPGEGFFLHSEAKCNPGATIVLWTIQPERLFRSDLIPTKPNQEAAELQKFYDKAEIASFRLTGVTGMIPQQTVADFPIEDITSVNAVRGAGTMSQAHVKGTVAVTATIGAAPPDPKPGASGGCRYPKTHKPTAQDFKALPPELAPIASAEVDLAVTPDPLETVIAFFRTCGLKESDRREASGGVMVQLDGPRHVELLRLNSAGLTFIVYE